MTERAAFSNVVTCSGIVLWKNRCPISPSFGTNALWNRLTEPDPVFHWIRGTGARPVLQALPDAVREQFEVEYKARLSEAYPDRAYGTVMPFRRIFVVAQRSVDQP